MIFTHGKPPFLLNSSIAEITLTYSFTVSAFIKLRNIISVNQKSWLMKTTFFIGIFQVDRKMLRNIQLRSYVRQKGSPKHKDRIGNLKDLYPNANQREIQHHKHHITDVHTGYQSPEQVRFGTYQ